MPLHFCEFKLNLGDIGFTDLLRLSHCTLEKLMQICFPFKTSSYQFSLTAAQCEARQNSRHKYRLLSIFPLERHHDGISIPPLVSSSFPPL